MEAVLQATGDVGADVVYDLAGGDFVERSWRCTARGGRYLAVGYADDDENGMTGRPLRMASIGNIDLVGVMVAWVDSVDPGMRRFGFNPFGRDVADEVHGDLLRLCLLYTSCPTIWSGGSICCSDPSHQPTGTTRATGPGTPPPRCSAPRPTPGPGDPRPPPWGARSGRRRHRGPDTGHDRPSTPPAAGPPDDPKTCLLYTSRCV